MVNESEFMEGTVLTPNTLPDFNWDWFNSVPKWYYTYWSKLAVIRSASVIKQVSIPELSDDVLTLPNNCLYCSKMGFMHGFGMKRVPCKVVYNKEKKAMVFGEDETVHFVHSDNANFAIGVTTWKDGETSWVCWSTRETLGKGVKDEVLKFVKSLGFNPDMAVETPFQNLEDAK